MMKEDTIKILGARVHNLKNVDLEIPRRKLVVITGLSGSGKSSLAFDTIYAEGQRRYMETLSTYARQFVGTMERPDVDKITGLSPVVAIEQKTTNKNPRSTVGTVTEINDFLRLLYARAPRAYSPVTGEEMVHFTDEQIAGLIMTGFTGRKIALMAPIVKGRKGHYRELFESLAKKGYIYARIDGEIREISSGMRLDRYKIHAIDLVVDRLVVSEESRARLLDSLKEFPELPLTIEVNDKNWEIKINWKSGSLSNHGASAVSYPAVPQLSAEKKELRLDVDMLVNGINKTIFATADDELRPVMNGIYINLAPGALTFVGTDAHKLVKYEAETENEVTAAVILPKMPANLLKSVLLKEDDAIEMAFDSKNALFKLKRHTLVCRLIEGNYPNYNAVIPANNPNKVLVDRIELVNGIKRVAVCSNPTTNLIRMDIGDNLINLTAQDIDFSVSANETITCSYDGEPNSNGFK